MDLRDITEFLKDIGKYVILILAIILMFTFIVAFVPVAGNSMSPTLEEGDVVVVGRLFKNSITYKRNDIITLQKDDKSYIKRIVGLPGEEVHYLNGYLYIDGVAYEEKFLESDVQTSNFMFLDICDEELCPDGVIPEDYYLVLGDNREESTDSRTKEFGLVSIDEIQGKVLFRIWPVNSLGTV